MQMRLKRFERIIKRMIYGEGFLETNNICSRSKFNSWEISEIFNQYPESRLHFKNFTTNKNFILQFYSDNKFHFPRAQFDTLNNVYRSNKETRIHANFFVSGSWLSRPEVVSFHFFFLLYGEER